MLTDRSRCRAALTLAPLMLVLLCGTSIVHGQTTAESAPALTGDALVVTPATTSVEIAERFARVLRFPKGLRQVDGFDPTVLSVTPLAPDTIRISALEQGVTTLVATDENQTTYTIEIFVTGDARLLASVLKRNYPNTAVTVTKVRDSVLLRGWVSEPQQISEITAMAMIYYPRVLNQMKVGGPQEVQLRVQVMEVQRSQIRRFGINFAGGGQSAAFASTPGPVSPLSTLLVPLGGPATATLASSGLQNASMALGVATDQFVFQGLIQALKQEGLLKIQSEPVLVTRSGEAARLVNGGEFPIPVPGGLGTVTIEWREFGTVLESLPIVISPTRLRQQITAEVSERDTTSAVTLNGTTVPGLSTRRVQTNVEMEFGQTLVIGGLLSTRYTAQTDKIPFLGELPGLGAAFRRVRYDTAEVELVVLITPEYVAPLTADQLPPGGPGKFSDIPTDRELYGQGLIEVPNYGERCANGNCPPPGMIAPGGPQMVPGPTSQPYSPGAVMPSATGDEPQLILPGTGSATPPPPPLPPLDGSARRNAPKGPTVAAVRPRSAPQRITVDEAARGGVQRASASSADPDDGLIEPAGFRRSLSPAKP